MVIGTGLMTAEELFKMPHGNRRYELVKGELIEMSPAGGKHGVIALHLGALLDAFVRGRSLGVVCAAETGFILARNPDIVRAADVSFISKTRIPKKGQPTGYWELAPDLAVEVISPSDPASEVQSKVVEYLSAGTRLVWVIDPESRTVTMYRSLANARVLTIKDVLDGADVLPGFSVAVSELFE